ncbi:MAG: outer membrane protein transport protein [Fibromonadaceae bacterium]|jgi:long-chain fatty acid transport protein|nr:outer membrane protein transport protein [Fibromonadaceae bacterium]
MKKALFAVVAASSLLFAESYQVNTLSTRQLGMAHTGAGIKLGSESMHFNPGGLGFVDKTLDVSAGATFIMPEVEFYGKNGKTTNTQMGTPFYVYAASSITDWLSAGLSFTTPYGNSADYGKDWEGAGLLQDISLQVFALQPTIAFKFLDKISVGGGPVIYFGSFEQSKDMVNPDLPPGMAFGTFSGDADLAVVANVGILYDLIPNRLALGIAYRSEAKMKVSDGKTEINYANPIAESMLSSNPTFIALSQSKFKAELPLPANLNTGISFRPIDKLLLAFDFQMIFWGIYDELVMDFTVGDTPILKQVSKKDYSNTFAYRFGAQYSLMDQLDLRLGMYFDETPVKDDYLTPESPSTNKLGSTVGLSFRPISNLSIDAAFLYANGSGPFGRDATSGDKKGEDGLNGRYEVQAWVPSIGLSYSF